jgi:hypothetical protein
MLCNCPTYCTPFLGRLTVSDGLVGALWKEYFITSPNADYIPTPILDSTLVMRTDFFYGPDDYLLWPQQYEESVCHLAIIRKTIERDDESVLWHMWERYDENKYFTWRESDGCIGGFGHLKSLMEEVLSSSIYKLVDATRNMDLLKNLGVGNDGVDYLTVTRLNLECAFARLRDTPCTKEQAHRGWIELQRAYRLLDALWSYYVNFRHRIPNSEGKQYDTDLRLMGTFTHVERHAQYLFAAGIPVWLIRPISVFRNQNILKVVEIQEPTLCLDVPPHYTQLSSSGSVKTRAKFLAIEAASHQFYLHPDPFELAAFDNNPQSSKVTNRHKVGSSPVRPVVRPNTQTSRYEPYRKSGKPPKVDPPREDGLLPGKGGKDYFPNLWCSGKLMCKFSQGAVS